MLPSLSDDEVRQLFRRRLQPSELPSTPFVANYAPYTENQLRDVHFRDHAQQWDNFYRNNGRNAYKDRHYILREFIQLNVALRRQQQQQQQNKTPGAADAAAGSSEGSSRDDTGSSSSSPPLRRQRNNDTENTTTNDSENDADGVVVLLLDFGCGVGNLSLPLLDEFPHRLKVVAVDLSAIAIQRFQEVLVQRNLTQACVASACDVSNVAATVEACTAGTKNFLENNHRRGDDDNNNDKVSFISSTPPSLFATLVFVLCSVPRQLWANVVESIAKSLRQARKAIWQQQSGGRHHHSEKSEEKDEENAMRCYLFFRDYCDDDLAMHRFSSHRLVVDSSNSNSSEKKPTDVGVDSSSSRAAATPSSATSTTTTTTTFMRSNGTLSHFFTMEEVRSLFTPLFEIQDLRYLTMQAPTHDVVSVDGQFNERRFLQGTFVLR